MSGRQDNAGGAGLNADQEAQPFHKPFSWLNTEALNRNVSFIESVADMCAGIQTCLQLVNSTDMALHARTWDGDDQPVLGRVDKERLLRLAIAVTGTLADGAHKEIAWINDQARKTAKESAR
ncbi:hypothetical protein [Herbaspirillum sp. SJZ107]|uniref:hypothetical protein n=1 Tax=Herbaspirillum sp. SJZ107 TaxID=2572881 RepID=UPI0011540DDB|nr:hypothetical protein [Herbaspirillum sp. SJZ107]TQK00164.1 hypothetical protein FBX97_5829 [Herbaspirillum sp. SJZ107]